MILGLFLILIILIPYKLEIKYQRDQANDEVGIIFRVGFIPIPIHISVIKWIGTNLYTHGEVGGETSELDVEKTISITNVTKKIISLAQIFRNPLTRRLFFLVFGNIEKINVKINYSTGDAALTASSFGLMWSSVGSLLGFLNNNCTFHHKPNIIIEPSFSKPESKIMANCIFRIYLGQIIIRTIKIVYHALRKRFGQRRVKIEW